MGILAPLFIQKETHETLRLSSGWGTLKISLSLMAFAGVLGLMNLATRPLIRSLAGQDWLLNRFLPLGIWLLSGLLIFLAIILLGYRQFIESHRNERKLQWGFRIFGLPIRKQEIKTNENLTWQLINQTPKRYRPESNPKNRPVGFWELQAHMGSETFGLDRAPQEAEMQGLKDTLVSFLAHDCSES